MSSSSSSPGGKCGRVGGDIGGVQEAKGGIDKSEDVRMTEESEAAQRTKNNRFGEERWVRGGNKYWMWRASENREMEDEQAEQRMTSKERSQMVKHKGERGEGAESQRRVGKQWQDKGSMKIRDDRGRGGKRKTFTKNDFFFSMRHQTVSFNLRLQGNKYKYIHY